MPGVDSNGQGEVGLGVPTGSERRVTNAFGASHGATARNSEQPVGATGAVGCPSPSASWCPALATPRHVPSHHTMKRLLFVCLSLALAVPATQVLAGGPQDPQPGRPPRPGGQDAPGGEGRGQRQASPLRGHMEALEAGLEQLATALAADGAADQSADLLKRIAELEKVSIDAKGEAPRMLGRLEGAELQKAAVSYRAQMQAVTGALFAVELKVAEGDLAGAKKAFAELEKLQQKGHNEFRPRRGGRGEGQGGEQGGSPRGGRQGGGGQGGGGN